ncbi:hypothetical protein VOLCADRAFT_91893 [Volvox carteri f. nagariensis]|uniref:Uncharacterized protein n=1 Tax=Volvox carteri f. nagariensis TaxID=3068 RepID=D8TY84_VOLCA|nr:uncharacterized protein VOLCADRAFT_91893 [Volvox carteri f. nagariensis]EFJ47505.1 hypothetical protein VOLCADRAFT_91893 [Volvox carteri f. nagariensis]|eukprot:XP_002951329.1 hypothetical protein VOLCADRAFT_91893 [Volvox carteri f. nagariensis]
MAGVLRNTDRHVEVTATPMARIRDLINTTNATITTTATIASNEHQTAKGSENQQKVPNTVAGANTDAGEDIGISTHAALAEVLEDLLGVVAHGRQTTKHSHMQMQQSALLLAILERIHSEAEQQPDGAQQPAKFRKSQEQAQAQEQVEEQAEPQVDPQTQPQPLRVQLQEQQPLQQAEQQQPEDRQMPQSRLLYHRALSEGDMELPLLQKQGLQQKQQQPPPPQQQQNLHVGEQQHQDHQLPQLTILMPSTFKDIGRALMSITSVKTHLAPELIREGILLTPWTEYLAVRRTVSPNMGGRPCDPACYTGSSSKVAQALQAAGLLPTPPDAARSTSANSSTGISTSSSSSGGSSGGTASLQDYCDSCGPPLWVVPEHLALGVERQQMSQMQIHGYRLQDSDVLMVRHVGPQQAHWLFPEPGKALYQPQRRKVHHRWWNTTEAVLGLGGCLSADPDTSVFGVTPALLATDISASVSRYWDEHLGGGSRLRALGELLPRRRPFLTEYCSYHLVAECVMGNGTMNEYHALRRNDHFLRTASGGGNGGEGEVKTPLLYRGSWRSGSWARPGGRATTCKDCVFRVLQSNAGVSESKVVRDLEEVFA